MNDMEIPTEKLQELDREIKKIIHAATRLQELGEGVQAIERNARRILASAKMLEINVSDILHLLDI